MKKLMIGLLTLTSLSVFAAPKNDHCIIGGRYRQSDVEKAFEEQLNVDSVKILKSRRSFHALNPFWAIDRGIDIDYRVMSLEISHERKVRKHRDCKAFYYRGPKQLTIFDCSGRYDSHSMFRLGGEPYFLPDYDFINVELRYLNTPCLRKVEVDHTLF